MSSKASASTTLTLVPEIGTFNQYLICNKGDLWQNYEGSATAPTNVTPDFSVTRPLLSLMVSSSRTSGSEIPDEVKFYINDVLIGSMVRSSGGYSKSVSTDTAVSSVFELLDPTENTGMYGLRIKSNLVTLTGGESGQIRAVFKVSEGTSYAELQTSCAFLISEVTENSSIVVIEAGDNNNFRITDDNSSVKLAAKYYRGLTEITTGIRFRWYKQKFGANPNGGSLANWEEIAGQTGSVLTVSAGDVETSQIYMVHVLDSAGTTVLGQDTQSVYDATDLFEIAMAHNPEDGQVHKKGDFVEVTCTLYRRNSTSPYNLPANAKWSFIGTTPAGVTIFSEGQRSSNVCTVNYDDIYSAGGQLLLTISVDF